MVFLKRLVGQVTTAITSAAFILTSTRSGVWSLRNSRLARFTCIGLAE